MNQNLSLAAQSVDEWGVWEETVFIFGVGQFSEKGKSVFLGDFISYENKIINYVGQGYILNQLIKN